MGKRVRAEDAQAIGEGGTKILPAPRGPAQALRDPAPARAGAAGTGLATSRRMSQAARPHVVILGGGFAGLESAFLLRHRLHDRVDISLVSDQPAFLFRPDTIYIPYGADPDSLRIPLEEPTARRDMKLHVDRALDVDPISRRVSLASGGALTYDKLIIATGAAMRPGEVPGLAEHGGTIWTPVDMLALRGRIERIVARGRAGQATRVLFLIPPNNKCAGPLYASAPASRSTRARPGR